MLVLPGKAPLRGGYTDRLKITARGPRGPSPRQEERLRSRQGRERGFGRGRRVVRRGSGGEQWIHRSRWRTDGSDYHSILRDGGREAGRPGEEVINGAKERESEDVVMVKKQNKKKKQSHEVGARKSIDMLLWCLKGDRRC